MPSQSRASEDNYNGSRAGQQRVRERRVQDVPDDRIEYIRRRELASFYGEPEKSLVVRRSSTQQGSNDDYDDDYYANRRMVRKDQSADDTNARRLQKSRTTDDAQTRSRGRDQSPESDTDSAPDDKARRRRQRRRARSEKARPFKDRVPMDKICAGEDPDDRCWYTFKKRKDANFFERHLDPSYDGLFAAVAGGAIGAMGVNRLLKEHNITEEESKAQESKNRWKTAGAAVVGAVAFNAAENWFRVYTDSKSEHPIMQGVEGAMECVDNLM